MKTKKWAVERTRTIQGLIDFIKKFLKLMASEQLFIYVNQSFAPSPDQEVGTLYECFGSDGKLVLHYCKSQAWGWTTAGNSLLRKGTSRRGIGSVACPACLSWDPSLSIKRAIDWVDSGRCDQGDALTILKDWQECAPCSTHHDCCGFWSAFNVEKEIKMLLGSSLLCLEWLKLSPWRKALLVFS